MYRKLDNHIQENKFNSPYTTCKINWKWIKDLNI